MKFQISKLPLSSNNIVIMFVFIVGIGMDASVTPLRHGGLSLVQTTDFFYPLVEDPYMQGFCFLRLIVHSLCRSGSV